MNTQSEYQKAQKALEILAKEDILPYTVETKGGQRFEATVEGNPMVWYPEEETWKRKRGPRKEVVTKAEAGAQGGKVTKDRDLRAESAMHVRWSGSEKVLIAKVAEAVGVDMIDVVRMGTMRFVNDSLISGKVQIEIGHMLKGDETRRFRE
jgi:hypothetical protein